MIRILFFSILLVFFSGCSYSSIKINTKKQENIKTNYALHNAVRINNLDLVKELISKNDMNINQKDLYGYTPLHLAVRFNFFEIAKELIDNKADINTIDIYKDTPLLDSVRSGYNEISKILICNKADIKVLDKFNKTPLDYALLRNDENIVLLLQSKNLEEACIKKEKVVLEQLPQEQIIQEEPLLVPKEETFSELSLSLNKLFLNFKAWNVNYNKATKTFTFESKNIFQNKNLSEEYKAILNDFFPKYLEEVLKYKEKILNVYIEYSSGKKELLSVQDDAEKIFDYIKKIQNKTINENIIWIEKNFFSDGVVLEKASTFEKLEFKIESISN